MTVSDAYFFAYIESCYILMTHKEIPKLATITHFRNFRKNQAQNISGVTSQNLKSQLGIWF